VVFRWIDRLFGGLFLWSAYVQLNDPDPLRWIAIYTVAALVCIVPAAKRGGAVSAWLVSSVATAWAFWLAPDAMQLNNLSDLTASMQADRPELEAAREALGLAIVSIWTAGLGLRDQWDASKAADPEPAG